MFCLFQSETIRVVLEVRGLRGCDFGLCLPIQVARFNALSEFLFALCGPRSRIAAIMVNPTELLNRPMRPRLDCRAVVHPSNHPTDNFEDRSRSAAMQDKKWPLRSLGSHSRRSGGNRTTMLAIIPKTLSGSQWTF